MTRLLILSSFLFLAASCSRVEGNWYADPRGNRSIALDFTPAGALNTAAGGLHLQIQDRCPLWGEPKLIAWGETITAPDGTSTSTLCLALGQSSKESASVVRTVAGYAASAIGGYAIGSGAVPLVP